MKAKPLAWTLLLLVLGANAVQLSAQVNKGDQRLFEQVKAEAEKGDAQAQHWVGFEYFSGMAVTQNFAESVRWFRKAAMQGHADAQYLLGSCYIGGFGTTKDVAEGAKWYRKAAEQGNLGSQVELAACYQEGTGVPKDYVEAHKWFNLASANGKYLTTGKLKRMSDDEKYQIKDGMTIFNIDPKQSMSAIEQLMTKGQIAEAQQLAREFTPRKVPASRSSKPGESIATPTASGTGFFISTGGYLVSNNHVVEGASQVRLVTSAGLISAKVVKVDAANDLALLKAEGRFAPLPIKTSRGVKLGGTVATVGFPNIGLQGFAPKLAKGEIAALSGAGDDARYFQISVPVQPGNSGGALVDERGNVVGVVSAKLSAKAALAASGSLPENVNYAVKSSYLLSFLESVPEVSAKLKEPSAKDKKFEDVVKEAEQAAVLVLVY